MKTKNILLVGGSLAFLAALAARKAKSLTKTGKQLLANLKSIHSIDAGGGLLSPKVTFKVDVELQNPTDNTLPVNIPLVRILDGTKEVSRTVPGNNKIQIQSNSKSTLKDLKFELPVLGLLNAQALTNPISFLKGLTIEVNAESNGIPFVFKHNINGRE